MRYTECRLRPLAMDALLADVDAGTVDWAQNFDASQVCPAASGAHVID
jgi:DNA gyrase/topoisomerase IV subunit A